VILTTMVWSSLVSAFLPEVTTTTTRRIGLGLLSPVVLQQQKRRRQQQRPGWAIPSLASRGFSLHAKNQRPAMSSSRPGSSSLPQEQKDNDDIKNDSSGSSTTTTTTTTMTTTPNKMMMNLHTIRKDELEQILVSWGYPKYRADQIIQWVRQQGAQIIDDMINLPKPLRAMLQQHATLSGSLELDCELISKDGTRKRAYKLWDGQLIESVLMGPYQDGRYTACISSQAGCAQGCVFCATGQMGFSRQLTPDEIFEQVSRFASELAKEDARLSNVVFMGMGEPLANYRNVVEAIHRIQQEIGIGARKITVSTVGLVPNIRKLMVDLPQVRLAVSLHSANDAERSALLPANDRYGGLTQLMSTLHEYIETTGRRITLEWALIEGENDTPETAHELGQLLVKNKNHSLRRDMVHVNVIPLNPTGGYGGSPSGKSRVNQFIQILEKEYGIACTPRVRRGIDINAGCGQLKAEVEKRKQKEEEKQQQQQAQSNGTNQSKADFSKKEPQFKDFLPTDLASSSWTASVGVYEDDDEEEVLSSVNEFVLDEDAVDFDDEEQEEWEDFVYTSAEEQTEADRLLALVQNTIITADNTVIRSNADYKKKKTLDETPGKTA
jgi:23S rRNA (adenine2503-C2)-methyltransferase